MSRYVTLVLCTILHLFTHAYVTMLVPLYLLMVEDLHLEGARAASFIVSVYVVVYCLGSYGSGILADRFDRRWLLGIGLIGNGLVICGMGLVRNYGLLIPLGIVGGLFGTLFHPAANALVPAHFPRRAGLSIGLLGIGAALGFYIGPQYAGWRAETATWQFGNIAQWQKPCVELGLIGVLFGIIFLLFASEVPSRRRRAFNHPISGEPHAMLPNRGSVEAIELDYAPVVHRPISRRLRWQVVMMSLVLGCRDFAGVGSISLASLYLQGAYGYDVAHAGAAVGGMMLIAIIINPLAVIVTPGRIRLPALSLVLVLGAIAIAAVPFVPRASIFITLSIFQACQLGSYTISDAATLERVPDALRGRVSGLFLSLAGTMGAISPFAMGASVDMLKDRAIESDAYIPIFLWLGAMMLIAAFSTPLIARLKEASADDDLPHIDHARV